ncbi:sugar phosphate isomerase/epimerase family protein [Halomonas rhizosphaerae]|uniref:Sugar phosphate isomerase/epimerase family protein n=1 Tax=Halomonas rhizosphaerae TaxID=3043296 RepID=A0ABT6V2V6_9GAMM|nr:sugar phosphate isomerase/epimerase family protein [Halomonas rhizosphaerae]MDI5891828.1 sugar phosphate isomerase/epimerase family protein [Halomonas rhizosphaerae]
MKSYVSVSTAAYDGYGFHTILPSLARCGVRHVEFAFIDGYVEAFTDSDFTDTFANDLKSEMQRHGQECRYFSGHIDLGGEDATVRLEARCRFAASLGASFVITNAASRDRGDAFFRQADTLAAIAKQYGVRILLENPGNRVPNVLDHAGDVAGLLERVDRDAFGINYDVGNLLSHCPEREPLGDVRAAMSIADHFHLKPCIRTPDGIDFVPFGKGDVDDAEVATELLIQGKPFSLELPFRLHRDASAQPWRDELPLPLEMIESCVSRSLEELDFLTENA